MISYTGTKIESFRQAAKDGEWTEKEKEILGRIAEAMKNDSMDTTYEEIENLCPDCKVYCTKRYIDGRCE